MAHRSNSKKIMIVSPGIEDGGMRGLGRVTFALINSLSDLGYEVYLLTGAPIGATSSNNQLKNITLRRSVDHYLSEGIHSNAFNLSRLRSLLYFFRDSLLLAFNKTNSIKNKHKIPAQHEPLTVRQFANVDVFVNVGLIYRASRLLPKRLCSIYFFAIARSVGASAIITASPFPILRPLLLDKKIKVVQSLHDVMPLNILETPPDSTKKFAIDFFTSMKNADLVITSSINAKNKLTDLIGGINANAIYVPCVPLKTKESIYSSKVVGVNKRLNSKYILFMSALEKRKNVSRLFEAFDLIQEITNYKLVVVGSPGYGYKEIEQTLQKLSKKTRENIIMKGYVSEEEKWTLINEASIVAHPAIDEGLGIPVIEALIAKRPVVATRLNSFEEFAPKNSITYIEDPYDTAEIADKLLYAIHNENTLRAITIANSNKIIKLFNKDAFTKRLSTALKSIDL